MQDALLYATSNEMQKRDAGAALAAIIPGINILTTGKRFLKARRVCYLSNCCICMYLWGVAVLELDSNFDLNKGPDPHTLRWSTDPSHRS